MFLCRSKTSKGSSWGFCMGVLFWPTSYGFSYKDVLFEVLDFQGYFVYTNNHDSKDNDKPGGKVGRWIRSDKQDWITIGWIRLDPIVLHLRLERLEVDICCLEIKIVVPGGCTFRAMTPCALWNLGGLAKSQHVSMVLAILKVMRCLVEATGCPI